MTELLVTSRSTQVWETPAGVYLSGLATSSQQTMRYALIALARLLAGGQVADIDIIYDLPWHQLSHAHLLQLRSLLADQYALNTANLYLSALRGVLRASWKLSLLTRDEYARLVDFDPIRGTTIPKGRALTSEELKTLFTALSQDLSPRGRRDGVVIALLYSCGFRRSELISLGWEDFELITVDAQMGYRIILHRGKGRKARINFVNPEATKFIHRWIEIRGRYPGSMICRVDRLPLYRPVTAQTIYDIVTSRAEQAGIGPTRPHDLRRTMCTRLLDSGIDVFRVQRLMGHADVATTQKYDRRTDVGLISAAFSLGTDFTPPAPPVVS